MTNEIDNDDRRDILDVTPAELGDWLHARTQPGFRLDQILEWVYRSHVAEFDEMKNVPLELRREMESTFRIGSLSIVDRQVSRDADTGKLLVQLDDGERIECVWMNDDGKYTFCVSSQVGCPLDCRFCATGSMGFSRDLTMGEIIGQVMALAQETGELRNIVFMGMGEPLLNLDVVMATLRVLTDERCFGLGARRITVSTAGIVPAIGKLATCGVSPNLALSLNSPFGEQRSNLMPVNKRYPLKDVVQTCNLYGSQTGRRVSLEYVMLGGVNTSVSCARALGKIALDVGGLVNLIALNPFAGCFFKAPGKSEIARFRDALVRRQVTVTQRYKRGRDIAAACGQLRTDT